MKKFILMALISLGCLQLSQAQQQHPKHAAKVKAATEKVDSAAVTKVKHAKHAAKAKEKAAAAKAKSAVAPK